MQEGEQDALAQEHAGGGVGDGDADAHRAMPGFAGDRHQAAHALHDLVDAGARRVRAVLTEARDGCQDDARVDRLQLLVGEAEALLHRGAEIFHHDVGAGDQPGQHFGAGRRLQIEAQAALVAMQVLLVGAVAAPGDAADLAVGRRVDADHVGAPVGQQAHGGGPGAGDREVEHGVARQGQRGRGGGRHGGAIWWKEGSDERRDAAARAADTTLVEFTVNRGRRRHAGRGATIASLATRANSISRSIYLRRADAGPRPNCRVFDAPPPLPVSVAGRRDAQRPGAIAPWPSRCN